MTTYDDVLNPNLPHLHQPHLFHVPPVIYGVFMSGRRRRVNPVTRRKGTSSYIAPYCEGFWCEDCDDSMWHCVGSAHNPGCDMSVCERCEQDKRGPYICEGPCGGFWCKECKPDMLHCLGTKPYTGSSEGCLADYCVVPRVESGTPWGLRKKFPSSWFVRFGWMYHLVLISPCSGFFSCSDARLSAV